MKKLFTFCCTFLLAFMLSSVAYADEQVGTATVKYGAIDHHEISTQLANAWINSQEYPEMYSIYSLPASYTGETALIQIKKSMPATFYYISLNMVKPTFVVQEVPDISISDPEAASKDTIRAYMNEYKELTQTNEAYDDALGTAPTFELNPLVADFEYSPPCVVVMIQNVCGVDLTQTVRVTSAPGTHTPQITEISVKYGLTNIDEVWDSIATLCLPDGWDERSESPKAVTNDTYVMTVTYDVFSYPVTIHVVQPTFKAQTIPSISADSAWNSNVSNLEQYAARYNALEQTNTNYTTAMGVAPTFVLNKYSISQNEYIATGRTYELKQYFIGQEIRQTLTVNPIGTTRPNVY